MARIRYVAESASAILCGLLAVLTFAVHDWIEVVFGVDPDRGSGSLELAIVVGLAVLCLALTTDVLRLRRLARARA